MLASAVELSIQASQGDVEIKVCQLPHLITYLPMIPLWSMEL